MQSLGLLSATFRPRVQSKVRGITLASDLCFRAWRGVIADLWSVKCDVGAGGEYESPDPRLFAVLDRTGSGDVRIGATSGGKSERVPLSRPLCFIPAGVKVWSLLDGVSALTHLDVHIDVDVWARSFEGRIDCGTFERLRLGFSDNRVLSLAHLLAQECAIGTGPDDLYGEGLCLALIAALSSGGREGEGSERGLSPSQLRLCLEFLEEAAPRNVRIAELAGIADLSPAHFSRAFKSSTGLPPHRWQMQARVNRAKALLSRPGIPLSEVAAGAGFADQAHLTRVFRQITGRTPATWRLALWR